MTGVAGWRPLKGPPGYWLPVWAQLGETEEAYYHKEGTAATRRRGSEGCGFESRCKQGDFFIMKSPLNTTLILLPVLYVFFHV